MRAFVLRWLLGTAVPPRRAWSHAGSNPELHAGIRYLWYPVRVEMAQTSSRL